MNIHEYQAKAFLRQYGVATQDGEVAPDAFADLAGVAVHGGAGDQDARHRQSAR